MMMMMIMTFLKLSNIDHSTFWLFHSIYCYISVRRRWTPVRDAP